MKCQVRDDSVDALESMDLDAYLNHHEEMTILSVIEESNKLADESMQEMQQRFEYVWDDFLD